MISIVIPIYNEEENIEHLYSRLTAAGPSWEEDYEVVLVDDGSVDRSLSMMLELVEKDERIKVVKLSRNFGHQQAITAGLRKASGDCAILMDGDLQDPPEELPRFLKKWREGYHVVYAVRTKRKEFILKRMAYSIFYRLLASMSNINIPLDSGDFCLIDRRVVDVLNDDFTENIRFVRGLRAYVGFKQIGVKYERAERSAGEVKYTLKQLMRLAMDGLLDFSFVPLRLASFLGIATAFISLGFGLFHIIQMLTGKELFGFTSAVDAGMTSMAIAGFFIGGMILLVLGIIGEYIGRIYFEVKRRPAFVIEDFYTNSKIIS